jgi:hypothetical protein
MGYTDSMSEGVVSNTSALVTFDSGPRNRRLTESAATTSSARGTVAFTRRPPFVGRLAPPIQRRARGGVGCAFATLQQYEGTQHRAMGQKTGECPVRRPGVGNYSPFGTAVLYAASTNEQQRSRTAVGRRSESLRAASGLHPTSHDGVGRAPSGRPGCAVGPLLGGCVPCNTAPAKYM